MKRFTKLSLLFFAAILVFTSCDEETYADWKILNEKKYAEEVAAKTDYTLTESGLCYQIIYPGEVKQANINSYVTVRYTGKLITGVVFDSGTYTGYLSNTVVGWQQAITKLKIGGSMDFFFPTELGYGETKNAKVPPYSMLYFSVELLNAQN